MKILEVADRPGWAIDRFTKPVAKIYDNVDISYFAVGESRFLQTGFTTLDEKLVPYSTELGNKYDVVHFHRAEPAIRATMRLDKKVKKIISLHNERSFSVVKDWKIFDAVICPTKFVYEEMKSRHDNVYLVPYGIDLEKYHYKFEDRDIANVGFVGRVIPHKRFDVIHKACIDGKLKLISCGYIEDPLAFTKWIGKENGEFDYDYVTFLPEVQMVNFYAQMKMFVSISEPFHETGPLPVLEAMACGVPVISTYTGWAKDWAKDKQNIWFVSEDEMKNLGKLLRNLVVRDDILTKLRNNAMRLVSDFSIEKYAERLMDIYVKT